MWASIWYVVLWIGLVLYFGVALIVAIGGVGDIRRMFSRMSADDDEHSADETTGETLDT